MSSSMSGLFTQRRGCAPQRCRTRSSSSCQSQRAHCCIVDRPCDDDFRTYRKFSADVGSGRGQSVSGGEGIVKSLLRRCRSQSNTRSSSRRRHHRASDDDDDDEDDDDGVSEYIELNQLSGFPTSSSSSSSHDAGHQFTTVYVDDPVWCDKCGQLIISVYGHYVVCQCEYDLAHNCAVILLCYITAQGLWRIGGDRPAILARCSNVNNDEKFRAH